MIPPREESRRLVDQLRWNNHLKNFIVLAGLLLFGFYMILVLTKPISQDEGVFLTIGKYLNHGRLPYQDFFDHKPPAMHFLFAALFKLFGPNLFVAKLALIISILGSAVLIKKISEALKPETGWSAAILFLFLMTQFEGNFMIAESFMLLPLLACLWLLLRVKQSPLWLFLAGVFLGIAILFKQTVILSALPLVILAGKATAKRTLVFMAGLVLPIFVIGTYLWAHGLVAEAWRQVVTLTLTSYPREPLRFVLQSLLTNFFWTLPIWILLLLGLGAQARHKKVLWALVLVPLPGMFFRHYPHYWVQLLPFVALLAAIALTNLNRRALTLATVIFCLAIGGGKVGQNAVPNFRLLAEQLRVADVLRQEPTDVVLAENQFAGFYFLLPQPPLNKYLYLTEITNAEQAEQRTIADLQHDQTVMILWPEDPNYAYAKKLQAFILAQPNKINNFPVLGMRMTTYRPVILQ